LTSYESNSVKIGSGFSLGTLRKTGVTKKNKQKARESNRPISHIYRDALTLAIALDIGASGDIADIMTHAEFCDSLLTWHLNFTGSR